MSVELVNQASSPTRRLPRFARTDVGNGQLFAAMHGGRFRYVWDERVWLEWRGGRWRRDESGAAERAAKDVARELLRQAGLVDDDDRRKKAAGWAMQTEARGRMTAMLAMAASEPEIVVTGAELDTDPYLLSCANGTLDLGTGKLREPDPGDLISRGTDVAYVPGAGCARFEQFLEEVFAGDHELIAFVKRFYGSCLTGDTRDRAVVIEYGQRFNGKSTLNRAIQRVLGDFAHTAPIRVIMRRRESDVPSEIAALAHKRLVLVAETADGHKLDESRVKMLTGRDRVSARPLYREWIEFEPEFKLVLFTNFKPRIDGPDGATWDRIRLVPFSVSFEGREDKELGARLEAEAEGILAWLVEGCREWQAEGLGTCEAVEQATRDYRDENDVFGRFVHESCELGDEYRVERKALREALADYCRDSGDETPAPTTVGRWLKERGIRESKPGGIRGYRGIRMREESA